MNLETYKPLIDFIEQHQLFSRELATLTRSVMSNETSTVLSEECKKISVERQILKDVKTNEFVNTEILHFFYVLDFLILKSDGLNLPEEWHSLFSNINKPQFNSYYNKVGHKFIDLSLIIANRYFNINIPQLIIQNVGTNSRLIKHSYFDVFPVISSTHEDLVDALFIATVDIKAEDNYLNLNKSVREKSYESFQFGHLLIDKSKTNIEKAKLFIPYAFLGITDAVGVTKTFSRVEELLKSQEKELKKVGIRSVGMLHGYNDNPAEVEDRLLAILNDIENAEDDSLLGELIFLYGLLIDKLSIARQKLIDIPNKYEGKEMSFALATMLNMKIEEELNQPWITNSLLKLSNLSQHHVGTYAAVARALHRIIESNPEIVFNYFHSFINEDKNSIDDLDAFKNLFSELRQKKLEILNKWITIWFNNENYRFHRAAAKVLRIIDIENSNEIQLDKTELDKLHPFDIEFILYKVVGYTFSKEHLQSIVYSALAYSGEVNFIARVVTELFCYYITYNYPGSLDYLKQKKGFANERQKQVIETVQQFFEEVYSVRKEKPKELQPSHERLQQLFNQSTKQFSTLEDKSKFRQPSFLDLVTKVSIKTGDAFFTRDEFSYGMKNRYANKSTMGHISRSFEFPGGEFLDPIGQEYNRYIWRTFKRRST